MTTSINCSTSGQVAEEVKEERLARLMQLQEEISGDKLARKVGKTLTVLVDEIEEDGEAIARSAADAPEIDGVVIIENGGQLQVGEFAEVTITSSGEHDLWATVA